MERAKAWLHLLLLAIALALGLNYLLPEPTFDDPIEGAENYLNGGLPNEAKQLLADAIDNDSTNIAFYYWYLKAHFRAPEISGTRSEPIYRNDEKLKLLFRQLTKSSDENIRNMGYYGQGYIATDQSRFQQALTYYKKVRNTSLPYWNNSIANAYGAIGELDKAEFHYKREIDIGGTKNSAYTNLARLYLGLERLDKLETLLSKKEALENIRPNILRTGYFHLRNPLGYIKALLLNFYHYFNIWGFLGALLITGSWMMYLRRLDIFEHESWFYTLLTLALGAFFSVGTFFFTDVLDIGFGMRITGDIWNDFIYCVFAIGVPEELVKIIPLLLLLRFTNVVNEPYDYIQYASLSALGFAFAENLLYLNESQLNIIHARLLTAAVAHMFDSSIIAYGLVLARYKTGGYTALYFMVFFMLASLAHGFYDFWLLSPAVNHLAIVTIIFLVFSFSLWNLFKNNSLNHSDFFDRNKFLHSRKLSTYLIYSLGFVILFEYFAVSVSFGIKAGNIAFFSMALSSSYLLILLIGILGQFRLDRGKWMHYRISLSKAELPLSSLVERKVTLVFKDDAIYLATITENITVSGEPDWYKVALEQPLNIADNKAYSALIHIRGELEAIYNKEPVQVGLFFVPDGITPFKGKLYRQQLIYLGLVDIKADNSISDQVSSVDNIGPPST